MTAKEAIAAVQLVYPQAYESGSKWHTIHSGPARRTVIGVGFTSAKAWKDAAAHLPSSPYTETSDG